MKKFQFSLQKVLDVACAKERLALEDFAKAQDLVANQKALIKGFKADYDKTRFDFFPIDLLLEKNRQSYLQVLQVQIKKATKKLNELQSGLQSKRVILVETMKNRKLLEKLKEKALDRHKKAEEHEEQLFLDEIGVIGFARKEGEEK